MEPWFRVVTVDEPGASLSLPEVLGRLSAGDDLVFLALRPHQQPAWHAFLVQLACLALEAADWPPLPAEPSEWQNLLRGLTPTYPADEPWHLCVDDWSLPAFLQSPGDRADYRGACESAQELDLLVTSKNHDEKIGKLRGSLPQAMDVWVYALVSLQGFAGVLGRGNYSTMRMNGGFASRPQFRLVFAEGSGAEFVRDVQALRVGMDTLLDDAEHIGIGSDRPMSLLWLAPWSDEALPLARVHPLCLEVARRIRLQLRADQRLCALTAASMSMRVGAKDNKGLVLDPWIPIIKDGEPRAFTAQADSFSYHRLAPLLFDEQRCKLPLLAEPTAAERDRNEPATLRAQVLVGGSGRTDGCLRRDVPMPVAVLRRFVTHRGELARRARLFIELAALAQGKVLRPALLQYVDGGDEINWQNKDFGKAVAPWIAALERRIDDVFFDALFATESDPPMPDDQARRQWAGRLRTLVNDVFGAALPALPSRDRSRHFARSRAERLLQHAIHAHLADEVPAPDAAGPRAEGAARKTRA